MVHTKVNPLIIYQSSYDTLKKWNKGCTLINPNNSTKWKKQIIGFVDDKRQYTNDWNINLLPTAVSKLQSTAQSWEHLLHASSERLEYQNAHGIASVGRLI